MEKHFLAAMLMAMATPSAMAQVASPDRPVTDPQTLQSPSNPDAQVVPLEDISASSNLSSVTWSADGKQIFVTTNLTGRYNIWRTDTAGSWPVRLTQSDEAQTGLEASVDGQYVYFLQDEGGNEYPDIFRVSANGGKPENLTESPEMAESSLLAGPSNGLIALVIKRKSEGQSNLAIMDSQGTIRTLTDESQAQYAWSPVAWTMNSNAIIANRTRIGGTEGEIWSIEVVGGKATKLLGKPDTVYHAADLSPDERWIAVSTNEGGQMRAGLYDLSRKTWKWLNPTPWEQHAKTFSPDGNILFFETNADARNTIYQLDIASGKESALSIPPGHNIIIGSHPVSPDDRKMMIYRSGADTPGNLYLYDIVTAELRPATHLAIASLRPEALPRSEIVTYRSFDGTLISAVVTMPANLKRDASHPAIVLPHGGPTGQSRDMYHRYATAFASRGYVVIRPNFRGSTGYGKAFQAANVKDLGGGDLKDTIEAKHFLVKSGFVDPRRVGIFGSSYGGFLSLMAIGRAPDEFAAAVQWYGIINWRTMYRDQDERLKAYQRGLLGTPSANPDVYDAASPLTYIDAAKAPLLTIQGENDIRVPKGQAQEVHDILTAKGNIIETIYYPSEGHGFKKRENQIDSLERTVSWFDKYLKSETND